MEPPSEPWENLSQVLLERRGRMLRRVLPRLLPGDLLVLLLLNLPVAQQLLNHQLGVVQLPLLVLLQLLVALLG